MILVPGMVSPKYLLKIWEGVLNGLEARAHPRVGGTVWARGYLIRASAKWDTRACDGPQFWCWCHPIRHL